MTILAAIDGSDRDIPIIREAWDLATAFDEPLVVLYVLAEDIFEERHNSRSEYYQDDAVADAKEVAREQAESALGYDDIRTVPSLDTDGSVGEPAARIQDKANEHDVRYIVMGARKRSPIGKAMFGSTTQSVLLNVDRPVVSVLDDQ